MSEIRLALVARRWLGIRLLLRRKGVHILQQGIATQALGLQGAAEIFHPFLSLFFPFSFSFFFPRRPAAAAAERCTSRRKKSARCVSSGFRV